MTRLAIIFSLLFVTPAWAESRPDYVNYEHYKTLKESDPDALGLYLKGIFEGTTWHNTWAEVTKKGFKLYCITDRLPPNTILEKAIETAYSADPEESADTPLPLLGIHGLTLLYPCD